MMFDEISVIQGSPIDYLTSENHGGTVSWEQLRQGQVTE
jgi:hypothetical protein